MMRRNIIYSLIVVLLYLLITISSAKFPEIIIINSDDESSRIEKIFSSKVHLNDDVMIALRPGYILKETGKPSLNRSDLSQPSTSYAVPYLYALILTIFEEPVSLHIYVGLGLLLMLFIVFIIIYYARSKLIGSFLILLVAVSITNSEYILQGSDHIFMAFFLLLATHKVIHWQENISNVFFVSMSCLLAFLFRPDALIIVAFILIAGLIQTSNKYRYLLSSAAFFGSSFLLTLYLNYLKFGYITPTTARLKIGASPSVDYMFVYLHEIVFDYFTVIHVVILCFLLILFFRNKFNIKVIKVILSGIVLTFLFAFYNSDVFVGGRLYFGASIVLIYIISQVLDFTKTFDELRNTNAYSNIKDYMKAEKKILLFLFAILIVIFIYSFARISINNIYSRVVTNFDDQSSPITKQILIANWINSNLEIDKGSIGLFYLGIGYHLKYFELADFLGKGDEEIAQTEVRWGPPGHNKWDIDISINKWKPQVIVPASGENMDRDDLIETAILYTKNRLPFSFHYELFLNKNIIIQYHYCYIQFEDGTYEDYWGMFVRNDVAIDLKNSLQCYEI